MVISHGVEESFFQQIEIGRTVHPVYSQLDSDLSPGHALRMKSSHFQSTFVASSARQCRCYRMARFDVLLRWRFVTIDSPSGS